MDAWWSVVVIAALAGCGRLSFDATPSGDGGASADATAVADAVDGALADTAVDAPGTTALRFVSNTQPQYVTATSLTASVDVTAGDLLIAAIAWDEQAADVVMSDTIGMVWTALAAQDVADPSPCVDINGTGVDGQLWFGIVPATASGTVTVTQSVGTNQLAMYVVEYAGISPSETLVASAGSAAVIASNAISPGALAIDAPALTVALYSNVEGFGTIVPATGWTIRGMDTVFYSMVVDNAPGGAGDVTPAATLPVSPAVVSDACWVALAAAFRLQ